MAWRKTREGLMPAARADRIRRSTLAGSTSRRVNGPPFAKRWRAVALVVTDTSVYRMM